MATSKVLTNYLSDECANVARKIRAAQTVEEKAYYFSATWAAAQRLVNIEPDAKMLHLHVILAWVYGQFANTINAAPGAARPTREPPDDLLDRAAELTDELGKRIRTARAYDDLIEQFCVLGYSASGNGYYLAVSDRLALTH